MNRSVLLIAILALSPLVAAGDAPHQLTLDQSFDLQQAEILSELRRGKLYKEISPDDRAQVTRHLQRISGVLAESGSETFAALSPARQTEVINSQELVNQLLTQAADDSRLVCVHERRLGTRIRESVCQTKAQRDRFNNESRKDADDRLSLMRAQDPASIGR